MAIGWATLQSGGEAPREARTASVPDELFEQGLGRYLASVVPHPPV